ncbi:MAG: glycosyltransferase [Alistipes sp.]|jgi:glycosyltransferase involved in cell wall biosynthesis|nr:glycosyltransferase [Alistipes sp.]
MPLISVIVPVYNAEKYLARCIDSVLAQTHADLELILVDDGSRDRSGAICDAAAARDPRVKVIHKANGGVSAARNDGIEASRGEWIAFCDNDDFYAPAMLERLLEICLTTDADIAQCRCEKGAAESLPTPPPQPVKTFTNREILENFYTEATIYIWDKLYRRHVWRDVRFPVGSYTGEDLAVVHLLLWAADRVATTRERLYYHFRNPHSVMQRGFDVRWATGALTARLEFARREGLSRLAADTAAKRVYEEGYLLLMNRRYGRAQSSLVELPSREEENERSEVNRRYNRVQGTSRRDFHCEHHVLFRRYYREAMALSGVSTKDLVMMTVRRFVPPLYHLYNYLKFRVLRRDCTIRFGEVK